MTAYAIQSGGASNVFGFHTPGRLHLSVNYATCNAAFLRGGIGRRHFPIGYAGGAAFFAFHTPGRLHLSIHHPCSDTYIMRGWDEVAGNWVFWMSQEPAALPYHAKPTPQGEITRKSVVCII